MLTVLVPSGGREPGRSRLPRMSLDFLSFVPGPTHPGDRILVEPFPWYRRYCTGNPDSRAIVDLPKQREPDSVNRAPGNLSISRYRPASDDLGVVLIAGGIGRILLVGRRFHDRTALGCWRALHDGLATTSATAHVAAAATAAGGSAVHRASLNANRSATAGAGVAVVAGAASVAATTGSQATRFAARVAAAAAGVTSRIACGAATRIATGIAATRGVGDRRAGLATGGRAARRSPHLPTGKQATRTGVTAIVVACATVVVAARVAGTARIGHRSRIAHLC